MMSYTNTPMAGIVIRDKVVSVNRVTTAEKATVRHARTRLIAIKWVYTGYTVHATFDMYPKTPNRCTTRTFYVRTIVTTSGCMT